MSNSRRGTGTITQRSKGSFWLRYYAPDVSGKKVQQTETVKGTKTDAERVLRERLRGIDKGAHVHKKTFRVGQFLERFMNEYACNKALKTQQGYRQLIDAYTGPIAHHPIQKLTGDQIQEIYDELRDRGVSPTALALHRVLHRALK